MDTSARARRPFTLLDGMILVAATAGGFGLCRAIFVERFAQLWTSRPVSGRIALTYLFSQPCVVMEMIGYIVICLRQPRPRLRRIMDQPGMVACMTVVGFLSFTILSFAAILPFGQGTYFPGPRLWLDAFLTIFPAPAGIAVAVAWIILALGRRWRCDRNWIGGLGLALGIYWFGAATILAWFLLS
jgi:hypothetical protein